MFLSKSLVSIEDSTPESGMSLIFEAHRSVQHLYHQLPKTQMDSTSETSSMFPPLCLQGGPSETPTTAEDWVEERSFTASGTSFFSFSFLTSLQNIGHLLEHLVLATSLEVRDTWHPATSMPPRTKMTTEATTMMMRECFLVPDLLH